MMNRKNYAYSRKWRVSYLDTDDREYGTRFCGVTHVDRRGTEYLYNMEYDSAGRVRVWGCCLVMGGANVPRKDMVRNLKVPKYITAELKKISKMLKWKTTDELLPYGEFSVR